MPRLEEQMRMTSEKLKGQIPDDALEVMARATERLERSGLADDALGVGDRAPDFSLPSAAGGEVALGGLRAQGPVVLSFYRGRW